MTKADHSEIEVKMHLKLYLFKYHSNFSNSGNLQNKYTCNLAANVMLVSSLTARPKCQCFLCSKQNHYINRMILKEPSHKFSFLSNITTQLFI